MSDSTTSLNRIEALNRLVARGGSAPEILVAAVHVVQRWLASEWCLVLTPAPGAARLTLLATTSASAHHGAELTAAEALAAQVAETNEIQIDGQMIGAPIVTMGCFRGAMVVKTASAAPLDDWDVRTLGLAAASLAPALSSSAPVPSAGASDGDSAEKLRKLARRIAHGLNNSLMPIVGHAELMLEDARALGNRDLEEGCTVIRDNGYEAAKMIRQLLEIGAQPDAGSSSEPGGSSGGGGGGVSVTSSPRFESHRVLVVDDDDRMLELIEAVLRSKLGCHVDRARDGAAAVSAIDHTNFNLVLSDVLMPRMNGVELMHWIDAHQPQVAGRLVFMTGDANPRGPGDELRRAGRPVLAKPFSLDALIAVAESVLQQSPPASDPINRS